ncbi:hypothetical protein Pst134EB_028263 [Puccinia striiformis f. sp. tritici]|nr:hypothetical protein Pst134EB_028263 [Puccinia striiformis f. sp. tritici]
MHTTVSVGRVLGGMTQKYDVLGEDTASHEKDPNLTVDDMGEKAEIWQRLKSDLLPSIKVQATALLTSLDLHDLEKHPIPDLELTREVLSDLDQTLANTVCSTISFFVRSPLPDEKHDHRMKNFKAFRFSQLRLKIRALIRGSIRVLFESSRELLHLCILSLMTSSVSATWQEASDLREDIQMCIAHAGKSVHNTIHCYQKSDWAVIRDEWLIEVTSCNDLLEAIADVINRSNHRAIANRASDSTPTLANLTINSADEANLIVGTPNPQNRREASRELMLDGIRTTISLVKLTRMCVKKALQMIPKKPVFELDTELNSEAIVRLQGAFGSITGKLSTHLHHQRCVNRRDGVVSIASRDRIYTSVKELSQELRSCLSDLESYLVPCLPGVDDASQTSDFSGWSLTIKQLYEQAVDRSLDLLSSLKFEPEQQVEQEN